MVTGSVVLSGATVVPVGSAMGAKCSSREGASNGWSGFSKCRLTSLKAAHERSGKRERRCFCASPGSRGGHKRSGKRQLVLSPSKWVEYIWRITSFTSVNRTHKSCNGVQRHDGGHGVRAQRFRAWACAGQGARAYKSRKDFQTLSRSQQLKRLAEAPRNTLNLLTMFRPRGTAA